MKHLIIAEHNNKKLKTATLNTISAAKQLGGPIDVLVAGNDCNSVSHQAAKIEGINQVICVDAVAYQHFLAENLAALVAELAKDYSHVLAPGTTFGKNFMPRAAALLDLAQFSDITKIVSEDTFVRPIYAGNAFMTVKALDSIKFLTIRTTAFEPVLFNQNNEVPVIHREINIDLRLAHYEGLTASVVSTRPDLANAKIVISGGRGLQNAENFKLVEKLADRLGAAIGASRAAVDAGFAPNDYQVGQTGKVVAPELYIAIGISGAIQHLAGMKDSKVIVAVNKDPDAPIFQVANYGAVGDLFEFLSEFSEKLDKV